jgi:hypothetical protein
MAMVLIRPGVLVERRSLFEMVAGRAVLVFQQGVW